jgi:excinuclease ABC subunit A
MNSIKIEGAREHNLKNINAEIPKNKLVVITGLSGSGKSSLAFDTIYVEGQRRYMESLSSYVRQFLNLYDKPDVDSITGISPTIAINQKSISKNNRSTVATVTEIYDYLRVLFARIGTAHSPATGKPIKKHTPTQVVSEILNIPSGAKAYILAPIKDKPDRYVAMGYNRFKINGKVLEAEELESITDNNYHWEEGEYKGEKYKVANSVIVDRIITGPALCADRIASSVENAMKISGGYINIEIIYPKKELLKFSEKAVCLDTGYAFGSIEPRKFSFNVPSSWCNACCGIGCEELIDLENNINQEIPLESALDAFFEEKDIPYYFVRTITQVAKRRKIPLQKKWKDLTPKQRLFLLYTEDGKSILSVLRDVAPEICHGYSQELITKKVCSTCSGYRLKDDALLIKIAGLHIGQVTQMTVTDCLAWFDGLFLQLNNQEKQIAKILLKEITERLTFLQDVGLEYLTLHRESSTLSGGEAQRIRLASQIGSGLTGIIYILDEPSIGLHQCDNDKLIKKLKHLRDLGNTVIVVEHDDETMMAADYILDIGPRAGQNGGQLVACGTPSEIINNKHSLTGAYLSGEKKIEAPTQKRSAQNFLEISGANLNNLKNLEIKIPLGTFVCVTGVSGSGKSTLVIDTIYRAVKSNLERKRQSDPPVFSCINGMDHIDNVIEIDQSPIGRAPFSNPVTYTGIFDHVRSWFANLELSKARGYKVGRFSFNVKGGRCENCRGYGMIKVEMQIIADTWVTCQECQGKRYNRETLEVTYKGKNISDILEMTIDEFAEFFTKVPQIQSRAQKLQEVGLGYLRVGQPSVYLSGGEAQRIKLAKELSKRATGKTLYILDEPTTGLHIHDVKNLLQILHSLVSLGNTVVVIEHNLHFIKTADYIFDIGPKGGKEGGKIIAQGTPQELSQNEKSITGAYLKNVFCV